MFFVTMQLQDPTMKTAQRTMSSKQVQHIDKEVDVFCRHAPQVHGRRVGA